MLVREVMSTNVELGSPDMSIYEAAIKMRDGDFGLLPVSQDDKLVGMITDRDITIRAVAEGLDPKNTQIGEIMSDKVLYCYEDQNTDEVAQNMGENQVRRLPVVNRDKRLVGILSLGDLANKEDKAKDALGQISKKEHREYDQNYSSIH